MTDISAPECTLFIFEGARHPLREITGTKSLLVLEGLHLDGTCKPPNNSHVKWLINESSWADFVPSERMAFHYTIPNCLACQLSWEAGPSRGTCTSIGELRGDMAGRLNASRSMTPYAPRSRAIRRRNDVLAVLANRSNRVLRDDG